MKNIVLDVNVVLDLWLNRGDRLHQEAIEDVFQAQQAGHLRCWVSAASLPILEYCCVLELKKDKAPPEEARRIARELLAKLMDDVGILSNLSFQQEEALAHGNDLEDAQILMSAASLHDETALLTNDRRFRGSHRIRVLSVEEVHSWLNSGSSKEDVDFIDLKTQQDAIRPKLERSIFHVLDHGQYILGPEVGELEQDLASFVGVNHCISCSSGTDALLIALMALDIGPGDEVITVPYTWISTAEVIALLNAKPVFVDIQPETFNMDPDRIEAAISPHTKAIMPVSIYGQCADMTRINAIAAKHNIPVIEDGAQSFGATHYGQKSCGLSTIGCTSFFPSKPLGCYGDGGAIFSNDEHLAEKMLQIHVHGQKVKHRHPVVGINGRFDTLQAAILLEKLEIFPEECSLRWEAGQRYNELFSGISGIQVPVIAEGNDSVYAQYTIRTEHRETVSNALKAQGIPSVAYYVVPVHLQGAFADLGHKPGDFPVAEHVASQGLSLPMYPYISMEDQKKIAQAVIESSGEM